MRLKKISNCKYTLEELVTEPKALDEVRDQLLDGTAFKVPHSISITNLRKIKNKLNKNFDLIDDTYTARVQNVKNYRQRHWDHVNQVVPAKFISWSYFPWNKDSRPLFDLKKVLLSSSSYPAIITIRSFLCLLRASHKVSTHS